MEITDKFLPDGEYLTSEHQKDKIFLHHTAGGHRPDWTIHWWDSDTNNSGGVRRVATAFVIGGKSIKDGNTDWDGKIYRAFDEKYWAVHLNGQPLYHLDKTSIGIEICNYGPLTLSNQGGFYNYVNGKVPDSDVVELSELFKGYKYYHKYTDAQMESLKELLLDLKAKYGIDLKSGLQEWIVKESKQLPENLTVKEQQKWLNENGFVGEDGEALVEDGIVGRNTSWVLDSLNKNAFEYNALCIKGYKGLWTHTNVRNDKYDCSPQPQLIEVINSL